VHQAQASLGSPQQSCLAQAIEEVIAIGRIPVPLCSFANEFASIRWQNCLARVQLPVPLPDKLLPFRSCFASSPVWQVSSCATIMSFVPFIDIADVRFLARKPYSEFLEWRDPRMTRYLQGTKDETGAIGTGWPARLCLASKRSETTESNDPCVTTVLSTATVSGLSHSSLLPRIRAVSRQERERREEPTSQEFCLE